MLLYVDGAPEGYPKELVQFLTYMKSSTTENACNPELEQIHSCVDKIKKDDKVQEDFMKLKAYLDMEMDAERKENANKIEKEKKRADEAEKRAGEEKSRADKFARQIIALIQKNMSSGNKSADDAMDELGIDADMRDYYKSML